MDFNFDMGGGIRYDSDEYKAKVLNTDGGKGSGNWGHTGRPGQRGGSAGKGGMVTSAGSVLGGASEKAKALSKSGAMAKKDSDLSKYGDFSKEAQAAYDKALAAEPKISEDMYDIAKDLGNDVNGPGEGGHTALEFSCKTAKSVADKIERKRKDATDNNREPKSDEEYVKDMGDLVRYTQMTDHNRIAESTNKTIDALKSKGYSISEVDNKYLDPSSDYKGVHINAISPSGQQFELQIHSSQSMDVKNTIHPMYEVFRNVNTPAAEKAKLKAEMHAISQALPMPKGIDSVKNFKS